MSDSPFDLELAEIVAARTGYRTDAVPLAALLQAARECARQIGGEEVLLARARQADPLVLSLLLERASVGETYFFRQPEHFEWVAHELVPEWLREGKTRISAWCAGCATGEEAYSLAAALAFNLPEASAVEFDVLGTDLVER